MVCWVGAERIVCLCGATGEVNRGVKGRNSLVDLSTDGKVVVIHVGSTTASVMSAVTIHGADKRSTYLRMTLPVTWVSGFNLIGN
jgi:hypothetical protein